MAFSFLRWRGASLHQDDRFVGPPLRPHARRDRHGRVYRFRSWWNADFTLHQISAVMLDGSPLPRLPTDVDLADDFDIPDGLRRCAK